MKHFRRHLFLAVAAALSLLCVTAPILAADPLPGEVLYHQDFSVVSSASIAGIRKGTDSSEQGVVKVTDTVLGIYSADNERTYALLPEIPWSSSYTIEFSFRFTDVMASNGYLSYILTCWGEKPDNITAVIFRASGKVDNFSTPSEEITACIQNGDTVFVKIPVENGILDTIQLYSGEYSCVILRDSLKQIAQGTRGFSVRNASVEIAEVFVVNGTDYSEKIGEYAEKSWITDTLQPDEPPTSPSTRLPLWPIGTAILSAGITVYCKRRKHSV